MTLTLIDRIHPKLRDKQQAAIDAGYLHKRDELELLDPQNLRPLLMASIVMLVIGTVFFVILNIASYVAQTHITRGQIGGWDYFFGSVSIFSLISSSCFCMKGYMLLPFSSGVVNPILGQSCRWHSIVVRKISCFAVTSISW